MATPTVIILGGADGSGKTTLAREFVALENLTYLGADDIAREINPAHPEQAAIEAARVFSQRFDELIERGEPLLVESTLSGLSLHKWIKKAQSHGYGVQILFVYLDSPALCIQRVAARVARGAIMCPQPMLRGASFAPTATFGIFTAILLSHGDCFTMWAMRLFRLPAATTTRL